MDFSFPEAWVHLSWALSGDHIPPAAVNFMSHPNKKKGVFSPLHTYLMAQKAFTQHRGI